MKLCVSSSNPKTINKQSKSNATILLETNACINICVVNEASTFGGVRMCFCV